MSLYSDFLMQYFPVLKEATVMPRVVCQINYSYKDQYPICIKLINTCPFIFFFFLKELDIRVENSCN